jgi:energy-converting hydrogenase Eha subunit F
MDLKTVDLDYIPEQHEKDQIHVWYNTHPLGGTNKEGNVFLIPTKKFKEQMHDLKYLRDFKDINYHAHNNLFQNWIPKTAFKLKNPLTAYHREEPTLYRWMHNKDLDPKLIPNFYPSFWEDVKSYTWGPTKDIILVPYEKDLKQFYDIERSVHFDMEYDVKPMDIIFISYDEPSAEKKFNELKAKYPRAKWLKGVIGQTLAYTLAAIKSETDYFFAVFPKLEIVDSFKFDFQPDRMKNPCHYIFNCKNPVNGLMYGHGSVLLYNKELVLKTKKPGLDFTLSQPHDWVPILSAINNFNETPWLGWRTAFREVIKLLQGKRTVETTYRLKKWCTVAEGKNAEWVLKGANDAQEYFTECNGDYKLLMASYDFIWLKEYYESKYKNTVC